MLGTEATVKREYTRALIRDYAQDCEVTLVGSPTLASYAEAELDGAPAGDAEIRAEIAPCFRDDAKRTDTVVLACTHYPLLLHRLRQLAPWPVNFIDPAPAIARRVVDLLGPSSAAAGTGTTRAIFTSGRAPQAVLTIRFPSGRVGSFIGPLNCPISDHRCIEYRLYSACSFATLRG